MHHHRRKSGHGSNNTSLTDVRKAVTVSDLSSKHKSTSTSRPTMSRRNTPQTVQKLGKNPRDREREWEEERWFDEERESFPQFCMTCEKQFVPADASNVYCSEACRMGDQNVEPSPARYSGRTGAANYPYYPDHAEPRDIIPRASPSRPSSTHFSPPPTPPSSAVSALRSLSIRPPSPPSPTTTGLGHYQTTLWPFTRSAATSPSASYYTRPASGFFSSTFDENYYYNATADAATLASRRPVHSNSRPKSIALVTPVVGR